jgi:phosphoenolpyruvate carboxylase
LDQNVFKGRSIDNSIFDFGFWPGGDRDGNPFVTPYITRKTADSLRFSILRNYYRDIRKLKRKTTFDHVDETISKLADLLLEELFYPKKEPVVSSEFLLSELHAVKAILEAEHNGIYSHEVGDMINKIKLFGFHFASLDIRQDSRVHNGVFETLLAQPDAAKHITHYPEGYTEMDPSARHKALLQVQGDYPTEILEKDSIAYNTLESIHAMKAIQAKNGEKGCNRYIISNCQSVENVLQLFAFFRLCDWENPSVDIIPLFETIPDLEAAEAVMHTLYSNPEYRAHLKRRGDKQTIMLGFSDGTKDGGYFMANWSIYKAKEVLSQLSKSFDLNVAFFDGRGGPPARGGGNTHKFYASMGDLIQSDDIQLTIQGQTISSNFGTLDSCQFNLEQLLSSGIENQVFASENNTLSDDDRLTLEQLAQSGYAAYQAFKAHPQFVPYLEKMTTLPYYAKTNIGSRPAKRGKSDALVFEDLRAIPFVGGWSQSKQNVPGFYGVGTALQELKSANEFDRAVQLYQNSRFFRTLIANSMMSMTKSFFQLTAYMAEDSQFGAFWTQIHEEFQLTKKLVLELTAMKTLMEDEKAGKASIKVREEIVQPLLTIQQYALQQIQTAKTQGGMSKDLALFEKMVTRSLFGNINASRNSA